VDGPQSDGTSAPGARASRRRRADVRDGTGRDRGRVMSASRSTVGAIARQRGTTAHDRGVLLGDGASASADGGGGASGADGGGGTRAHGNASTSTSGSTAPVLTCELVVKALGVFLTVVAVIGGAVYASTRVEIDLYEDVMPHVKNPVKFFIFNVLIASFGVIPGAASATCVTAGILYGTLGGVALCVTSAGAGAIVSFLLSRYAARPWVEKLLVRDGGRFKALDEAVIKDGSQIVLLVRLSPFSPFTAASYLLGLTSVSFTSYALATLVGVMPSSFVYVYLGDTGRRASGRDGATALEITFYVLGLLMTLFVSYRIAIIAQDAMRVKVGPQWDPSAADDDEDDREMDVFGTPIDEEVALMPVEREAAEGVDRRLSVV
jgi:uncharacterized membrane protein YdjX (TVP38/TMEM64 family)